MNKNILKKLSLVLGGAAITATMVAVGVVTIQKQNTQNESAKLAKTLDSLFFMAGSDIEAKKQNTIASKYVAPQDRLYETSAPGFSDKINWIELLLLDNLKTESQLKEKSFYLASPSGEIANSLIQFGFVVQKDNSLTKKSNFSIKAKSYANDLKGELFLELVVLDGDTVLGKKVYKIDGFQKVSQEDPGTLAIYEEQSNNNINLSLNKTQMLSYSNFDAFDAKYKEVEGNLEKKVEFIKQLINVYPTNMSSYINYDQANFSYKKVEENKLEIKVSMPYKTQIHAATEENLNATETMQLNTLEVTFPIYTFE
ncbi:MAG1430 family protein [Mycoplasmopsis glycophila]|uniref:Lipoprotein n=1 Tax=Mycoplasmopsis glycophila TaxID=171285 RepID=A0A449AUG2_9BACT|nr:hypothetical protein [Mycoplasmopsis glycophila]VEU70128.1 Uncharacterised protein [Mycoplasmopsis glycophila]